MNCWGVGERLFEVQRETIHLDSDSGPLKAEISYGVLVLHEVCEDGSASFFSNGGIGDKRKCVSLPRGRFFVRTITLIDSIGQRRIIAEKKKDIPDRTETVEKSGPCTDHATSLTEEGFQIGFDTAATIWPDEIANDQGAIKEALEDVGAITSTEVSFRAQLA